MNNENGCGFHMHVLYNCLSFVFNHMETKEDILEISNLKCTQGIGNLCHPNCFNFYD